MAPPRATPYRQVTSEAQQLLDRRAFDDAVTLLRQLTRRIQAEVGANSSELIQPLCLLAHALGRAGEGASSFAEEREIRERALDLARTAYGESSWHVAGIRRGLAILLDIAGDHEQAAQYMQLVAAHTEATHGEGPVLANDLKELGHILLKQGQPEEALSTFERCWNMAGGRGDAWLDALVQSGRGRALMGLGRPREAVPLFQAAYDVWVDRYGESNGHTPAFRRYLQNAQAQADGRT